MTESLYRITVRKATSMTIDDLTITTGYLVDIEPEAPVKREILRPVEPDEPDTNIEVGYSMNALERHTLEYRDRKVKLTEKPYILFRYINDLHRTGVKTEFDFAELSAVLSGGDELQMSSHAIESLIHRVNTALLEILSPIEIRYKKEIAYIHDNDAQFQQTINQINTSIQKFQKRVQIVNGITEMPGFKNGMAIFRDWSITAAAAGHLVHRAFSIVSSVVRTAITDMATFGDTYAKMSRRVGMGAKDLSLLGYAAEQSGASVSALGDGMKFLNRNIALAGQGSKAAQDAFAAIGIDSNRLQALDKKEQFLQVADAIRRLGDEAKQTDAAMKIFGRGGTSLLPMFQEGEAGIQKLMQEADELGLGISDEDAAKAEVLTGAIVRIKRSMEGFRRTIVSSLVEPMTEFFDRKKTRSGFRIGE